MLGELFMARSVWILPAPLVSLLGIGGPSIVESAQVTLRSLYFTFDGWVQGPWATLMLTEDFGQAKSMPLSLDLVMATCVPRCPSDLLLDLTAPGVAAEY